MKTTKRSVLYKVPKIRVRYISGHKCRAHEGFTFLFYLTFHFLKVFHLMWFSSSADTNSLYTESNRPITLTYLSAIYSGLNAVIMEFSNNALRKNKQKSHNCNTSKLTIVALILTCYILAYSDSRYL